MVSNIKHNHKKNSHYNGFVGLNGRWFCIWMIWQIRSQAQVFSNPLQCQSINNQFVGILKQLNRQLKTEL
jgi:hypothetical protein